MTDTVDIKTELLAFLKGQGYSNLCVIDDKIVGILPFIFTTGIVVGLDEVGYHHRYCYGSGIEARVALEHWRLSGEPEPRGYIKRKGVSSR